MDLWNALQKHMGHNVKITFEGAEDNPENILLQCEDCHFDILSADIETVCALSAKSNQSRRKSKPRIAQVLLGTWSRHRRNAR